MKYYCLFNMSKDNFLCLTQHSSTNRFVFGNDMKNIVIFAEDSMYEEDILLLREFKKGVYNYQKYYFKELFFICMPFVNDFLIVPTDVTVKEIDFIRAKRL